MALQTDQPIVHANPCRAREILDRVADKWSLYVVATLGEGEMRFTELKRRIDGVSQRMLTADNFVNTAVTDFFCFSDTHFLQFN